ncbi:MAG: hypothetical protein CBC35_02265 [Planctomycetes bacterium TMED75]|nr:hypothetical protein [Planctomycetaceae bacterium]OUU95990.1 MAG: hypothetical protein CBC35_02265 [Planctomycetes bacterium TMED75]
MRTLICTQLFLFTSVSSLFLGCEQQDPPARAAGDAVAAPAESGEIDTTTMPMPGSTGYLKALSGAKQTAENTKQKADDYNRKLEEQMDDLFTD